MFPGVNPKQLKQAMKKMGVKQEDLDAHQVIIRLSDRDLVINNPNVQKVNMMGEWSYQITGDAEERAIESKAEITEEDIQTVMEQTNVSKEKAKQAIEEADGDLAQAILNLSE